MQFLCHYLGMLVLLGAAFFGANLSLSEAGLLVIGMVIIGLGISGTASESNPSVHRPAR